METISLFAQPGNIKSDWKVFWLITIVLICDYLSYQRNIKIYLLISTNPIQRVFLSQVAGISMMLLQNMVEWEYLMLIGNRLHLIKTMRFYIYVVVALDSLQYRCVRHTAVFCLFRHLLTLL